MANETIRKAIITSGLRYWQVADKYGVSDAHFSRILRKELPQEKKERIFQAIKQLKQEGKA